MFYPQKCLSDSAVCVITCACTIQVIAITPLHGFCVSFTWKIVKVYICCPDVVATMSPCQVALFLPSLARPSIRFGHGLRTMPVASFRYVAFSQ